MQFNQYTTPNEQYENLDELLYNQEMDKAISAKLPECKTTPEYEDLLEATDSEEQAEALAKEGICEEIHSSWCDLADELAKRIEIRGYCVVHILDYGVVFYSEEDPELIRHYVTIAY